MGTSIQNERLFTLNFILFFVMLFRLPVIRGFVNEIISSMIVMLLNNVQGLKQGW